MALLDFISSLLNFLLTVVFLLFLGQGIPGLVYARLISVTLACAFVCLISPIEWRLEFDFGMLKELLVFGFPLQINDILSFIYLRIDTLMIGALLGPAEIAYYEIARKIPENLLGLYEAFRSVFFPFISKLFALGEHKKATQMLNHSMRLLSFVSILAALVALVFGNEIISLLFSAKYLPSVPVFVLLMIGLNFSIVNYTLGYSLVAVGDSDKPAIVNVVHMTISLLGNRILIPILGIVGAALASLAGFFAKHPLNVLFLRRRSVDVKVGEYLKPILIFGAYGLLFLILGSPLLILKVAIVVLFILTCVLLSVITVEDMAVVSDEVKTTAFLKTLRRLFSRSTAV
jgi:O-antigen/teichoic acid export membrane protein